MNYIISKLLIYGDLESDSILMEMADICRDLRSKQVPKDILRTRVYRQVKRILEVGTQFGFNKNLWHNYLAFLMITNENPFSITCEKVGASE